jgi:ferredoxin
MINSASKISLLLVALLVTLGSAFVQINPIKATATRLHLFGGLTDAFKNDASLGKQQNAGLKNGPKFNENVTVNGKPVQGAVAGQKLTAVAMKVRVKIPVNCQKGDCGTCNVNLNGIVVKGML